MRMSTVSRRGGADFRQGRAQDKLADYQSRNQQSQARANSAGLICADFLVGASLKAGIRRSCCNPSRATPVPTAPQRETLLSDVSERAPHDEDAFQSHAPPADSKSCRHLHRQVPNRFGSVFECRPDDSFTVHQMHGLSPTAADCGSTTPDKSVLPLLISFNLGTPLSTPQLLFPKPDSPRTNSAL